MTLSKLQFSDDNIYKVTLTKNFNVDKKKENATKTIATSAETAVV